MANACKNDDLCADREEMKKTMYTSECLLDSAVLGFQADQTYFDDDMLSLYKTTEDCSKIWMEEDFNESLQKAIVEFEQAGGNKVIEELNRQVTEWMKKVKK